MIWVVQGQMWETQLLEAPVCMWESSFPSLLSPNSPMRWRLCGFKAVFLLFGPDVKIINYSSAFIHTHLHWHSQSRTCIQMPPPHTHSLTIYTEIGLLATWLGLDAGEKASWAYQLGHMSLKNPTIKYLSLWESPVKNQIPLVKATHHKVII